MTGPFRLLASAAMPQPAVLTIIVSVGIALMGVAWFALKFWLASTRPPSIADLRTPQLDRRNQQALQALAHEPDEEDEAAPEGLTHVVPLPPPRTHRPPLPPCTAKDSPVEVGDKPTQT